MLSGQPPNGATIRLLVAGGRDLCDPGLAFDALDAVVARHGWTVGLLIHGACGVEAAQPDWSRLRGADGLADRWAQARGVGVARCPAAWRAHGPKAGPMRNQGMLDRYMPHTAVIFPGGRGTADMRARCIARRLFIYAVEAGPPRLLVPVLG